MAYALNIRSDNETSAPLRLLWDRCAALEASPSMLDMQYPPHLTLAVYDDIPLQELDIGLRLILDSLGKITIRFETLGYFDTPHSLILWVAPVLPPQVHALHARIHEKIGAESSRKHYRPGVWFPHCSLATAIPLAKIEEVRDIVQQPFHAVEVVFDVADCTSFMPVRVIKEGVLAQQP